MAEITASKAIEAIQGSGGFVTVIAKRLGCTRQTVYNLRDRYTTVAEALVDEREKMLDNAEGKLHQQINDGNMTAIIFYLKTQGKSRGYVERQEVTGADGSNLSIAIKWPEQTPED